MIFISRLKIIPLLVAAFFSAPANAEPQLITAEDIRKVAPFAKEALVQELIDSREELAAHGINTRLRMAHFLAQVMTETGGLKRLDENMNYSFETLMRVFSRATVSEEDARRIAGKPVEVANWVYGARLGNRGRDTMDGWNYRGSGYIQLTGRDNFLRRGAEIGLDIAADPDLAREPDVGLTAALAFWSRNDINRAADAHDRLKVRVLVNGRAAHGFAQSKIWFNKVWIGALRDKELLGFEADFDLVPTLEGQDVAAFDEILEETGFLDPASLALENSGDARREAILGFQRENGLEETGEVDLATEDALLDPVQWRSLQIATDYTAMPNLPKHDATVRIDLTTGEVSMSEAKGFEAASSTVTVIAGGPSPGPSASKTEPSEELEALLATSTPIYPDYAPVGDFLENPSPGVVKYGIFGDDDRYAATLDFDTLSRPFSSTVHILFKNKYGAEKSCTGAMVAPDAVLTAAHCIHSGSIKGSPYSDFVVVPGWVGGSTNFGDCEALDAQVLGGWLAATSLTELHESDLGLIKLDCEVGNETGWFGLRALTDEEVGLEITVQGYASDRDPRAMQWISRDRIRELRPRKAFHQADTFGGTSGAPIFASDDSETLLGIHTNTYFGLEEPWKSNNGFSPITPERLTIIANWIEN